MRRIPLYALVLALGLSGLQANAASAATLPAAQFQFPQPTPAQVIATLKDSGVDVGAIALQLNSTFNASAQQIAPWLKTAGYDAMEVARALGELLPEERAVLEIVIATYSLSAEVAATMFYGTVELFTLADVLRTEFNLDFEALAMTLHEVVGPEIGQLLAFGRETYGRTVAQAAAFLDASYTFSQEAVRGLLLQAGYADDAIREHFQANVTFHVATAATAWRQTHLGLYSGYFQVVASGSVMRPLHPRYVAALRSAGVNVSRVTIGYSQYLDKHGGGAAMTDCNRVYFPQASLVNDLANGVVRPDKVWWLLHELGHTAQCAESTRIAFANRWFGELPPSVLQSIEQGAYDPKAIHDAMPLEQQADEYATARETRVKRSLRARR